MAPPRAVLPPEPTALSFVLLNFGPASIAKNMAEPQYRWRNLSPEQRAEFLAWRKLHHRPWHSPPHNFRLNSHRFHVTAACYEHQPYIGKDADRLEAFSGALLATLAKTGGETQAWCVLPNHYHLLLATDKVSEIMHPLGLLHGRMAYQWNREENTRGRKVFFRCVERAMRSDRHFWATHNYILHNPVHHGYVSRWTEWPWSNAESYLAETGEAEAKRRWLEHPLDDYGKGWDEPAM